MVGTTLDRNTVAEASDVTMKPLADVVEERWRQDAKWGRHPGIWPSEEVMKLAVLAEEFGEVAKALLDEEGEDRVYEELCQVAATAVAWMESINERTK